VSETPAALVSAIDIGKIASLIHYVEKKSKNKERIRARREQQKNRRARGRSQIERIRRRLRQKRYTCINNSRLV
jgi:hypothetical protein